MVCRPYGTNGFSGTGALAPEVVGYFLSFLTGRNADTALIPLSFVPDGTQCGHAGDLRANLPATYI